MSVKCQALINHPKKLVLFISMKVKSDENVFHFILKSPNFFGHVERHLNKKPKVNFKKCNVTE